jgi:16S rRNA processing protein RimM
MAEAETWPDDAVEVGRVVDAWGVKGWIKVQPFSVDAQALLGSRQWFLKSAQIQAAVRPTAMSAAALQLPPLLHILSARRHGDLVIARTQELLDRGAAEALKGVRLFVPRASFPRTTDGEYYWVDLIGLAVVNRQGQAIGTVADLIDNGAQTVLRIVDEGSSEPVERLIPFVALYINDVSLAQRRITVDWELDF